MKHTRSSSEWEIRDCLVQFLRSELPNARIIHELNVDGGQNRADVAAVLPEKLLLFEIKSEKDSLTLLERQIKAFSACAHASFVVAHEKWFDQTPYNNGLERFVWPYDHGPSSVWCYPARISSRGVYSWRLPRDIQVSLKQPRARQILRLLWREELLAEAHLQGVRVGVRPRIDSVIDVMAYYMTGQQIARAVCRQLRGRKFAEADAPIIEVAA